MSFFGTSKKNINNLEDKIDKLKERVEELETSDRLNKKHLEVLTTNVKNLHEMVMEHSSQRSAQKSAKAYLRTHRQGGGTRRRRRH
jgi:peptidoglycan hydrolase CwlO-like protein